MCLFSWTFVVTSIAILFNHFPESTLGVKINLACPGKGLQQSLEHKPIDPTEEAGDIWNRLYKLLLQCPHLFKGRTLNVVSRGNNPHMSSDINKNIIYGPDGVPTGSNGGIAKVLSKFFGSKLNVTTTSSGYIFDNKTRKWGGVFKDVSFNLN